MNVDFNTSDDFAELERKFITAAALGDEQKIESYLDMGVPADATPSGKPSSLCYAVLGKNPDLTWLLLKHNADANFQDALGNTPCIYASLSGSAECLEILLRWGADLSIRNKDKKCAECYCKCCDVYKIIRQARKESAEQKPQLSQASWKN